MQRPVMRFFERWYGYGCPLWTWPLTTFLIGSAIVLSPKWF